MASAVSSQPYSTDQDIMPSTNIGNSISQPSSGPLRRASYIRIIDLANLCNINIEKMEELLKTERTKTPPPLEGEESDVVAPKDSGRPKSGGKTYQKRLASTHGGANLCL